MIDFSSDTYANLRQQMLAQVPNTYDQRDTAPIPTALSPAAYVLAGFYITLHHSRDGPAHRLRYHRDLCQCGGR